MTIQNIGIHDDDTSANGKHHCRRCAGTGSFITMVVNGRPTGPGGACFRCNGKGYHTAADRKRNLNYELYGRRYSA